MHEIIIDGRKLTLRKINGPPKKPFFQYWHVIKVLYYFEYSISGKIVPMYKISFSSNGHSIYNIKTNVDSRYSPLQNEFCDICEIVE